MCCGLFILSEAGKFLCSNGKTLEISSSCLLEQRHKKQNCYFWCTFSILTPLNVLVLKCMPILTLVARHFCLSVVLLYLSCFIFIPWTSGKSAPEAPKDLTLKSCDYFTLIFLSQKPQDFNKKRLICILLFLFVISTNRINPWSHSLMLHLYCRYWFCIIFETSYCLYKQSTEKDIRQLTKTVV